MDGWLLILLKIHFMILLWLICFFGLLAASAVTVYLILHYLYVGEQRVVFGSCPEVGGISLPTPPPLFLAILEFP